MPTALTHQLLAEECLKNFSGHIAREINSLPHYFFGAQGPDICFAYKFFSPTFKKEQGNFGSFLHGVQPELFFKILQEEAKKDKDVLSYAYGYLTHYAADIVFHPYILAESDGKDKPILHHSIEHACDGVLYKTYRGTGIAGIKLPTADGLKLGGVFKVYKRYAAACGFAKLEREEFEKSVKLYYLAVNVRLPFFRKERGEKAKKLFEKAIDKAEGLAERFYTEEISGGAFSKHYLTGEEI